MKLILMAIGLFAFSIVNAQKKIGSFKNHTDIGNPAIHGDASYNKQTKEYLLKGGGYNIWFKRDEFHYLFNSIKGDCILTANVKMLGTGKEPHRKIGWMLRESLDEDAAHICAVVHGDGFTVLQWRGEKGSSMRDPEDQISTPQKNIEQIQLERKGNLVIMRVAAAGESLQELGRHEMSNLKAELFAGLFICSHNANNLEEGMAWNVTITK